jgi:hypothetical protein
MNLLTLRKYTPERRGAQLLLYAAEEQQPTALGELLGEPPAANGASCWTEDGVAGGGRTAKRSIDPIVF